MQHIFRCRPFCCWGIANLHAVTGTLTPDASCNYTTVGWHNGKGYARREDGGFYIWWDGIDTWTISAVLGTQGTEYWTRTDPNIIGVYAIGGDAIGEATVAEGTHP
ncbi:hypothetical protein ES707_10354 [subsurface metagenome]